MLLPNISNEIRNNYKFHHKYLLPNQAIKKKIPLSKEKKHSADYNISQEKGKKGKEI